MSKPPFLALLVLGCASLAAAQTPPTTLEAVTFETRPGAMYVPVREAGTALGLSVHYQNGKTWLAHREISTDAPALPDGTRLIHVRALSDWGPVVSWNGEIGAAELRYEDRLAEVRPGVKSVLIDKSRQHLIAKQGDRVVLKTLVSTGRLGHRTPNGSFEAGPYKAEMHYSSLYNNAPMPYSVQIVGDIFVHGYSSVPEVPASHGCIRLPLDGSARFFYEWVEIGTPVEITGAWED